MTKSFWTRHDELWKRLVPKSGSATSLQGELIRATGRLADEAHRNGNINWDERHEGFCDFLLEWLSDPEVFSKSEIARIRAAIKRARDYEHPEVSGHGGALYLLAEMAVRWCDSNPKSISRRARRSKAATPTAKRSQRVESASVRRPARKARAPRERVPKPGTRAARIADTVRFVTDHVYASVRSDSRFDDVFPGAHAGGLGLVIAGSVKSQGVLEQLKQIVERAAPPMQVHWRVRVVANKPA